MCGKNHNNFAIHKYGKLKKLELKKLGKTNNIQLHGSYLETIDLPQNKKTNTNLIQSPCLLWITICAAFVIGSHVRRLATVVEYPLSILATPFLREWYLDGGVYFWIVIFIENRLSSVLLKCEVYFTQYACRRYKQFKSCCWKHGLCVSLMDPVLRWPSIVVVGNATNEHGCYVMFSLWILSIGYISPINYHNFVDKFKLGLKRRQMLSMRNVLRRCLVGITAQRKL